MNRYAIPAILWSVLVTILCLLPGKDLPQINIVNFDKAAHLFFYGILNWLYLKWFEKSDKRKRVYIGRQILISIILIAYGGFLELMQGTFYTDRFADVNDMIANAGGCLFALIVFMVRERKR